MTRRDDRPKVKKGTAEFFTDQGSRRSCAQPGESWSHCCMDRYIRWHDWVLGCHAYLHPDLDGNPKIKDSSSWAVMLRTKRTLGPWVHLRTERICSSCYGAPIRNGGEIKSRDRSRTRYSTPRARCLGPAPGMTRSVRPRGEDLDRGSAERGDKRGGEQEERNKEARGRRCCDMIR